MYYSIGMHFFYSKDNLVALHFKYDQARSRFVEWVQNEIAVVPDFHKRILFSDETHFWLIGYVNKQNCRILSEANPQVYVETPLHPEKLTVWCTLWAGGIIGPYFKNDEGHNVTVHGDRYRAMITTFFIPELNNYDVEELWFQQEGATCLTARATIDLLKDTSTPLKKHPLHVTDFEKRYIESKRFNIVSRERERESSPTNLKPTEVPQLEKSLQAESQVFDRIEVRTIFWSGQQLNDLRMAPVFQLPYCASVHRFLDKQSTFRRWKITTNLWSETLSCEANPQVYVETPLHPEKLTVWCALWAGGINVPYFFKNDEGHNVTVNGDRYRAMITNFFIPELNNHDVQQLWLEQDGATCHTARATIDLLKDTFGDRLISRFGPVNWPPKSCDLTPLDYFCGAM
ncbi:uncharacterized protein TNCV_3214111 [Trichonephila clavipes]|nr:uncharacterized protein TNCV_3214111 [Trichonephila clavipes]